MVIEQPEFDRAMRVANRLVTIPAIYDKLGLIIQEARSEFVSFSDVNLFCEKKLLKKLICLLAEFDRAMRVANRLVTIPAIYDNLDL